MARPDLYISADVETDGPIPGRYSMLSFGLAVAGSFDGERFERCDPTTDTFYAELQPISDDFVATAIESTGLDRSRLAREGEAPADAMNRAAAWVRDVADDHQPVLTAYPASFDWMFLYWYFVAFADGDSPFGFSRVLDMKTLYAAKARVPFEQVRKEHMPKGLLSHRPHTHNALDDAIEQADLFANLFEWGGR